MKCPLINIMVSGDNGTCKDSLRRHAQQDIFALWMHLDVVKVHRRQVDTDTDI